MAAQVSTKHNSTGHHTAIQNNTKQNIADNAVD